MPDFPLHLRDGHLFLELEGNLWLVDTGSPTSFGAVHELAIAGEHFTVEPDQLGLTPETLSGFTGVPCTGLLGADVLSRFDHVLDTARGVLTIATDELQLAGHELALDEFMGIPIVDARVDGHDHRMFFDTGAQLSYFQDDALTTFPFAGTVEDFYPGAGRFETAAYDVPVSLADVDFTLRCGALPGLLGMTLMMAGTSGIVGNAIVADRKVGYFPRRGRLVL